jgi:hypothetical protein
MSLGHYFESIHRFVLDEKWDNLVAVLNESTQKEIDPENIRQVLIRSEKHGALYHLASIEVLASGVQRKFALSTGVSKRGKDWLNHEFEVIRDLNHATNLPYLPRVYFKGEVTCRTGNEGETMVMSLAEWFGDYHEWHLSMNEKEGGQQILIWDQAKGYGYASMQESHKIYREASKILTLYYDTRTFSQIYPWHHGAGDFVVKREQGEIEVRLTTARKYEPVMVFMEEAQINPLVALIYFFLNLTLQMRLDKLDGTGDVTFSREDLSSILDSLMDLHRRQDPEDYRIIQSHLETHGKAVYEGIQGLPG